MCIKHGLSVTGSRSMVFSTNKTDHIITEILLKTTLNTKTLTLH